MKVNSQEIKFAENLHEVLPTDYTKNLALIPKENRDAIAEDFRRWRVVREVFAKRFGLVSEFAVKRADKEIRDWVMALEPEQYRDDMRRRLNELKGKLKK